MATKKMKAAVKTVKGDFEVKEVDMPEPDSGEVLIRVKASGICGSDLHRWKVSVKDCVGLITGHEFSGQVVEVGPDVQNLRVGVEPLVGCGKCYWCCVGQYHICPELSRLRRVFTGFAEYSKGPSIRFYKLPKNVSYNEAALLDCLAMGIHALNRSGVRAGNTVAVLGAGPIGLSMVAVAAAAGARVYCIGHHDLFFVKRI